MNTSTHARCADEGLVEAFHDGRLGARECASIERHLATCVTCRAHLTFLRDIATELRASTAPPSALAEQRARRGLLRRAAEPSRAANRGRAPAVVASVAFAAASAIGVAWALLASPSPDRASPPPLPSEAHHADPSEAPHSEPHAPPAETATPTVAPARPPASDAAAPATSQDALDATSPARPRTPRPPPAAQASSATPRPTEASPVASTPPNGASSAFAEAVEAVGRGDYASGSAKLGAFADAHPEDPRVDEADYLVAIALQRAGRADEAVAAARRYLARHPRGAHRREAEKIAGSTTTP